MFAIDSLGLGLSLLALFLSLIIGKYSMRYLDGDVQKKIFFMKFSFVTISILGVAFANDIRCFFVCWGLMNCLLAWLMSHFARWKQATNSGLLALTYFGVGQTLLLAGLVWLSWETNTFLFSEIVEKKVSIFGPLCLCFAAFLQLGLFPFQSWLLNSLNSPTPVSAFMHAGLINGGGFLLIRIGPLLVQHGSILTLLTHIGLVSALLGTFLKLIQTNTKNMLAASTMSQMGFMTMQCGFGLFAAAFAHLIWHGIFKAYLFLTFQEIGMANAKETRQLKTPLNIGVSFVFGLVSAVFFAKLMNLSLFPLTTSWIYLIFVFMAAMQVASEVLESFTIKKFLLAFVLCSLVTGVYFVTITLTKTFLGLSSQASFVEFKGYHILAMILFVFFWGCMLFKPWLQKALEKKAWYQAVYMWGVNLSFPKQKTTTSIKTDYKV